MPRHPAGMTAPPTLGYLWHFNDIRHLRVWCNTPNCWHQEMDVPLAPLIERFGADLPAPEIDRHFRCTKCGRRDVHCQPVWPAPNTLGTSI